MKSIVSKLFFSVLFSAMALPVVGRNFVPFTSLGGEVNRTSVSPDNVLQHCVYTAKDSAKVVRLLQQKVLGNEVLFYARQFKGLPYVASTLEVSEPEKLVVNLRGLDCTTLVETVLALSMTKRQGSDSFSDYCRNLMKLRYWNGKMDGYLSRLHYFTWWMHNNIDKGIIKEVSDSKYCTSPLRVNNYYMSKHSEKYKFLKGNARRIARIAQLEKQYNENDGTYLPEAKTGYSRKYLGFIHDGDLVAIVTRKAGLDYSHLGFAVWGKDGKLHLLNASSLHHKVVEEPKTLQQYLYNQKSAVGIRVFRLLH